MQRKHEIEKENLVVLNWNMSSPYMNFPYMHKSICKKHSGDGMAEVHLCLLPPLITKSCPRREI